MSPTQIRARVGANIRNRRKFLGCSAEAVALDAEIDPTYLTGIERGERNPTILILVRIAAILRTPVSELLSDIP